jgi:hypothetical protein
MNLLNKANQIASAKKEVDIDTYVIISTQNQIVNYLPYVLYRDKIKAIYNITISDSEKNQKWDSNLKSVLTENIENISFRTGEYGNIDTVMSKLKSEISPDAKILWNITGGQKAFLLAVNSLANERQNDFIGYAEGNASEFLIYQNGHSVKEDSTNILSTSIISFEEILNLNGFRFNKKKPSEMTEQELNYYNSIFKKYSSDQSFKTHVIQLGEYTKEKQSTLANNLGNDFKKALKNNNGSDINVMEYRGDLLQPELIAKTVWDNFITKRDNVDNQITTLIQTINCKTIDGKFDFGKFFEKMVFAAIRKNFAAEYHSIHLGVKINFREDEENANHIDELDCVIVKKNGQILNLELKTGSISGDVAKGHNYTTFASSGIYGSPILLIPTIKSDLEDKNLKGLMKKFNEAKDNAEKAQVAFWFIDELFDKIKNLLKS